MEVSASMNDTNEVHSVLQRDVEKQDRFKAVCD
jgi:hypothetical protein